MSKRTQAEYESLRRRQNAERCRRYRLKHPERIEAQREKKNERSREYQKNPEVRERRNTLRIIRDNLRKGHELGNASVPTHVKFVGNEVASPYDEESTFIVGGKQKLVPYYLHPLGSFKLEAVSDLRRRIQEYPSIEKHLDDWTSD